jgi:phosphonate transport system substrate-binding protein
MNRFAGRIRPLTICLCALLTSVGLAVPATAAPPTAAEQLADRAQTIVVGRVSMDPKSQIPRLEVLANHLAKNLHDVGIRRGVALVAADNAEMVSLLRDGAVDLVSETVFSGMYFAEEAGAEFLLREWKKGISEYRSVFFSRRDSGIRSIEDLRGRKIAFEDRGSTSGFLLPMAILKRQGLDAAEIPPTGQATPGRVSYAFAAVEVNVAAWVARGIADAGAFSTQDWEDVVRTPEPLKADLIIIYESEPLMRSAILARSGLPPELKARIKRLLLQLHEDPVGQDVLKRYNKVVKYDEISGDASRGLDLGRQLYPLVREEVR